MRFFFVLLLTATVFISCNNTEKGKVQSDKSDNKSALGEAVKDTSINKKTESPTLAFPDLVYGVTDIPGNVSFDGHIVASAKWTDKNGSNLLLITETDVKTKNNKVMTDDDAEQFKYLYGYHYILQNNSNKLLWKINDFVQNCFFDIEVFYIPNSLSITDLNNNGIGESSFMYLLACRSDVSPADIKLLMHENDTKYAIRGESLIKLPDGTTYGGKVMNIDPSFTNAPAGFLDYAKQQWEKFKTEKLD